MKVAIYSCHDFEWPFIETANIDGHDLRRIEDKLDGNTLDKSKGCEIVSIFSSDNANRENLEHLQSMGTRLIATRSAGTDHIDIDAARELGLQVVNVPEYSPNAIAEHCIALNLALYRKLGPSFDRIKNYNFSLKGQVGYEIRSRTVGICGTGDIGERLSVLYQGFGANILLFDADRNQGLVENGRAEYVDKQELLEKSDIISLNLPLNDSTENFITANELESMKESAILINTGRGGLVNTQDVLEALQNKNIAGFAMDVYEHEKNMFYKDLSDASERDGLLTALIERDNVVVTAHQGFLTETALGNMMDTVFDSIRAFEKGNDLEHSITR